MSSGRSRAEIRTLKRFHRRGRAACRSEWRLIATTHKCEGGPSASGGSGAGGSSTTGAATGGVVEQGVNEGGGKVVVTYTTPVFDFTGFAAPIDNGVVNAARAGQAIPVKYRLTAPDGTPVSDPASFVSVTSRSGGGLCAGLPLEAIETYAGGSGLQYLGDGNWQFNWKTPKGYAGQCRTMTLTLDDGSTHTAAFRFM